MTLKERMIRVETELKSIKNDTTSILGLIKEQAKMRENIKSNKEDIVGINKVIIINNKKYENMQSHKIAELWGIIILFCGLVANYFITFFKFKL